MTGTFLNHATIAAPKNGTTSHTVTSSAGVVVAGTGFTPTAGSLLVCVCEGSVTSGSNTSVPTAPPTGWTGPTGNQAVNNTGLYVWCKTAAGGDSVTTLHNGSNYAVVYDFYEFAAGSTFVKSIGSTGVSKDGGPGPVLSGLTGTNWIAGAAAMGLSSVYSPVITWNTGTEAVDTFVDFASTDGYSYGLTYLVDSVLASTSAAASFSAGGASTERLMFAINVATGGAPADTSDFFQFL